MKRKLEQAQAENDKPIPPELIRKFKVPRIDNINFIDTVNAVYHPRSRLIQIVMKLRSILIQIQVIIQLILCSHIPRRNL